MIRRLTFGESGDEFGDAVDGLTDLLVDAFDDDASLGFVAPFGHEAAREWWRGQRDAVLKGDLVVWVAGDYDATISLAFERKPNGRHRAYVLKLIVHRRARGNGLGRALLAEAERFATAEGVSLLLLDTETLSAAETLYLTSGWTRYGIVPRYAASPDGTQRDCSFFYKEL